ncbi:hypothetical protein JST97_07755 [bacterium]|nr:hypothetical protein [bacterium]
MKFRCLSLSCLLASLALAQEVPHPGKTRSFETIQVPSYFRNYNSLTTRNEWGLGEDGLLNLSNSYTLLQPSAVLDNFTLDYRREDWDATLGTQFLKDALPIYDQFVLRGARLGWREDAWSAGLWGGTTQDIFGELTGVVQRRELVGATLGYTPDDFGSLGLTVMPYSSQPGGSLDRTLAMAQVYLGGESEQGQSYGLLMGYGRDLQSGGASGQAFSAQGNYSDDRLRLNLSSFVLGRQFGPPQGLYDLRGRHFSSLRGEYRLSEQLSLNENISIYEFDLGTSQASRSAVYTHGLRYQGEGYTLSATWQRLSLLTAGNFNYGDTYFLNGNFKVGSWDLQPSFRQSNFGGLTSRELGLGVGLPLSSRVRLSVQEFYDHNPTLGGNFQTNLAVTYSLPDQGEFSFGYTRQDSLANTFFQGRRRDAFFAGGSLKLRGDLLLNATISQTFGQAQLQWLADDHHKLILEHRFQDPRNQFVYADFTSYPLGHYTNLSWTSSYGGPLQSQFERQRKGAIRLALRSHAPQHEDLVGIRDARVMIDDNELRTDENGEVYLGELAIGQHKVEIPGVSLAPEYRLEKVPPALVDVGPGEVVQLNATATAYAGVEVVVFNDVAQTGKLEALDYLPISGIKVRGPGDSVRETDLTGRIDYSDLLPGVYRFALQDLPAGYELGQLEDSVEVRSGERRRVIFGLRGKGRIRVATWRLKPGSLTEIEECPNLPLLVDGKIPVHSGDNAEYQGELWSGRHRVGLPGNRLNQSYLTDGSGELDVPVNGLAEARLVMADFATLRIQLKGANPDGVALTLTDPAGQTRTVYLDESGGFMFDHLKVGVYRLQVEPDTLPENFVVEGPFSRALPLGSGQSLELPLILRRRR